MKKSSLPLLLTSGLAGVLFLAGCQDKNNNGMPDSPATSQQIENKANNAGKTLEQGVEKIVPAIEKTAQKGANLASDAAVTAKVKYALIANKSIEAASIDVTTKSSVVFLDGHVASNAQRALASQLARNASGHQVKNNLKVVAPVKVKAH